MDAGILEIIILAAVAGFIFLRLFSVLGRRDGHQPGRDGGVDSGSAEGHDGAAGDNVVRLGYGTGDEEPPADPPPALDIAPDSEVGQAITALRKADPSFDAATFVDGAGRAYPMIVEAFAAGDKDTIRPLLGDEVFERFAAAIDEREAAGQTAETRVLEVIGVDIERIDISGSTVEVTVRFNSEVVNVTRDSEGRIIEGNPSDAENVVDVWTFCRKLRSRDPNWLLVATGSED